MKYFIYLAVLLFSLVVTEGFAQKKSKKNKKEQVNKDNNWLDGQWLGIGYQIDNSTTWNMTFVADTKNKTFKIEYPSLECGGNWRLVSINEHTAQFQEEITDGMQNCVNGIIVIITKIDSSYITFTCFSPADGKMSAYSTLVNMKKLKN